MGFPLPFFGNTLQLLSRQKNTENKNAVVKWSEDILDGTRFNKTAIFYPNHLGMLSICDVEVVEQLYTTHNSHFDKHPIIIGLTKVLLGESILFANSNQSWK